MQKQFIGTSVAVSVGTCMLLASCSSVKDLNKVNFWPFGNSDAPRVYQPANSVAYLCEGNKKFFVRMLDNGASAWLILPEREVLLTQSGDSKVYSNGISKLDLSADLATLTINETTQYVGCQANTATEASKPAANSQSTASATAVAATKSESKQTTEKGWLDRLKFWQSDVPPQAAESAQPAAVGELAEASKVAEPAPEPTVAVEPAPAAEAVAKEESAAPVAAVETPAPAAEEAKASAPDVAVDAAPSSQEAVAKTLEAWASAWRTKNADAYLSFYSAKFKPEGLSQKAWIAQRKQRVGANPAEITLVLDKVNIVSDAAKAEVRFVQHYASGQYSDIVTKVLNFENENGHWFIVKEVTAPQK